MSKRAEELSAAYTDARLELLRPDIAADNYTRGRKMSLDIFDGNEVESAYEAGYEQAEKETIQRIKDLLKVRIVERIERCQEDWTNQQKTRLNIRNDEDEDIIRVLEKLGEE